jgi:hypothetical protein
MPTQVYGTACCSPSDTFGAFCTDFLDSHKIILT